MTPEADRVFNLGVGGYDEGATGVALTDGTKMYLDNFNLNVVPEPAAMTLFAVGGLALLRRKRR